MMYGLKLFAGAAVLALMVVWALQIYQIQRLKGEIARVEKELSQGQQLWRDHPPWNPVERKELERAQERLLRRLSKDKDIPSLLQEISRLAWEYNMVDVSFNTADGAPAPGADAPPSPAPAGPPAVVPKPNPQAPPPAPVSSRPIESFPIKVTLAGDYREIAHFLDGLGKLPRLVTVQSLKVRKDTPLLGAEIVLHAYYQKGDLPVAGK